MAADPKRSAGARLERKAIRAYLRRLLAHDDANPAIATALAWVLGRQKRYDSKSGGLGK